MEQSGAPLAAGIDPLTKVAPRQGGHGHHPGWRSLPRANQILYATGVDSRPQGPFESESSRQGVSPISTWRSECEMHGVEMIDVSYELTGDGKTFLLILLTRLVHRLGDT